MLRKTLKNSSKSASGSSFSLASAALKVFGCHRLLPTSLLGSHGRNAPLLERKAFLYAYNDYGIDQVESSDA